MKERRTWRWWSFTLITRHLEKCFLWAVIHSVVRFRQKRSSNSNSTSLNSNWKGEDTTLPTIFDWQVISVTTSQQQRFWQNKNTRISERQEAYQFWHEPLPYRKKSFSVSLLVEDAQRHTHKHQILSLIHPAAFLLVLVWVLLLLGITPFCARFTLPHVCLCCLYANFLPASDTKRHKASSKWL